MTRVGAFSPSDARIILEVVRYLRDNGFVIPPGRRQEAIQQPDRIYFRNDSGAEVPPFACMEVTGTVEAGGQNYITITKPTSNAVSFLFNGQAPVADGKYGTAQSGPVYRAYKNTGTASEGERYGVTTGQWYLTEGAGDYVVYGEDDIESNVFKMVKDNGGSRLVIARLSAAWSGTAPNITASAELYDMAGNNLSVSITVRDPLAIFAALGSGDDLLAIYQDGKYYAIQAPC